MQVIGITKITNRQLLAILEKGFPPGKKDLHTHAGGRYPVQHLANPFQGGKIDVFRLIKDDQESLCFLAQEGIDLFDGHIDSLSIVGGRLLQT